MLRVYFHAVSVFVAFMVTTNLNAVENEKNVSPTLPSIALFKNGVTVVQQEIDIPEAGAYCWNDVPQAVHGTFFIESDMDVEVQTAQRLTTLPIDAKNPPRGIADCVGKRVTVRFSTEQPLFLQGKLLENTVSRESNSLLPNFAASSVSRPVYPTYPVIAEAPYKLEMADGRYVFLTGQQILSVETNEPITERTEYRPVMIFQVNAKDGKTAGKIRLFYLTKGVTWAPSYRVDLLNEKRLRIEQSTLIRNEWKPLQNTEISLVSGFPQIEASQILSPLYPAQTLQQFFQQILSQQNQNENPSRSNSYMSNSIMSQSIMTQSSHPYSHIDTGFNTTAITSAEGPDIHYNNIGKKTLNTGGTLSLSTGKGETDYRRVLECDLVQPVLNYYRNMWENSHNQKAIDRFITPDIFDVLKFPNPLPFPMTTAPATVTEKTRFLGQSQADWVNSGQIASVKITKVMNVRVTYFEQIQDTNIPQQNPMGTIQGRTTPGYREPFLMDAAPNAIYGQDFTPVSTPPTLSVTAANPNPVTTTPTPTNIQGVAAPFTTLRAPEVISERATFQPVTPVPAETQEIVYLSYRGYSYARRSVTGTVEISNQRNEEITLHLNGIFLHVPGKSLNIEPSPTKQSISAKDNMPNDLTDLFWELQLKPGEKKTFTISGTRWIRN